MHDSIYILLDPSRPLTQGQKKNNLDFIIKLFCAPVKSIYECDQNKNFEKWATYYDDWGELDYGINHLKLKNSLVIGYEMSPGFMRYCNFHDIKFISISISPIRFLKDLLISYQTNIIENELTKYDVNDDTIMEQARKITERYQQESTPNKITGKIIVEQLPLDSSTIVDGTFLGIQDVIDHFKLENFKIFKHPFSKVFTFKGLNVNPYSLMSTSKDVTLYGISSSLLSEARFFNIPSHRIIDIDKKRIQKTLTSGTIGFDGICYLRHYFKKYWEATGNDIESVKDALGFDWNRK